MDPAAQPGADIAPVAEPVAPIVNTPVVEDVSQATDDAEWDNATKEIFPGLKTKKKEEAIDESAKSKEVAKTPEASKDVIETPEQKTEREAKEAADLIGDDEVDEENVTPETAARTARVAARQTAQETETIKTDIRTKMFADTPQQLQDADGDPIKSINDVMKLMNPRTGQPFTQEEAGMWLLSAQQQFNQNLASVEKQIEQIADVNMDLKDQVDSINYQYGELLRAMPELRDEIWQDYQNTLVKDPKSNIIVKAPVSFERFYERALKPYADKALALEEAAAPVAPLPVVPVIDPAKIEADAKADRAKKRADRSDIFGGGKDVDDSEDQEWATAATAVFGPRK